MSELKKLFEIEGYNDGRRLRLDGSSRIFHLDGIQGWLDEDDGTADDIVGCNFDKPVWSLYKEPNDDIEYIGVNETDNGFLRSKINELTKKVNELSKEKK